MIIDASSLSFGFNPYTSNKVTYYAKSEEQYNRLIQNLNKTSSEALQSGSVSIVKDYGTSGKNDGFSEINNGFEYAKTFQKIDILSPWQQDYTAEDALNSNWLASTDVSLLNGFRSGATVKDEAVIGMDKEEFLAYVRENGLDKEINWSGVKANLTGCSGYTNFSEYSDYAAALYASLEDRILKDFSGDEQAEQLDKLNSIFSERMEAVADSYFKNAAETFEKMGVELDVEGLKESLLSIVQNKVDAYRDYIKENPDYAGLEGSEDKWLERDAGYMANALRNAYTPESVSSGKYSENDMIMVAIMGEMYQNSTEPSKSAIMREDEESIGLAIAMNYLTLQESLDSFQVSDDIRAWGEAVFDIYAKNLIDGADEGLEYMRNDAVERPILELSPDEFLPLDRDSIQAVVDTMIKTYQSSKDAQKAIYATVSFAYKQFDSKQNDEEYSKLRRYGAQGGEFWNNLYDNGNGYSYLGTLLSKWNTYSSALYEKDINTLHFNCSTRVYHSYGQTKSFDTPLVGGYSAKTGEWGVTIQQLMEGKF